MEQFESADVTRAYSEQLDQLRRELEEASMAFDLECAEGRNDGPRSLRPGAQAYEEALRRYRRFLSRGIVPIANGPEHS
jgi:hypothetical protein